MKPVEPMMLIGLLFSSLSEEDKRTVLGAALFSYLESILKDLPLDEAMKKGLELIKEFCNEETKYFIDNYEKLQGKKKLCDKDIEVAIFSEGKKKDVVH